MDLTEETTYDATLAEVYAVETDEAEYLARFAEGGDRDVEMLECGPDGDGWAMRNRRVITVDLPGFAQKALKPTNTIEHTVRFAPAVDGRQEGTFSIDGAPRCAPTAPSPSRSWGWSDPPHRSAVTQVKIPPDRRQDRQSGPSGVRPAARSGGFGIIIAGASPSAADRAVVLICASDGDGDVLEAGAYASSCAFVRGGGPHLGAIARRSRRTVRVVGGRSVTAPGPAGIGTACGGDRLRRAGRGLADTCWSGIAGAYLRTRSRGGQRQDPVVVRCGYGRGLPPARPGDDASARWGPAHRVTSSSGRLSACRCPVRGHRRHRETARSPQRVRAGVLWSVVRHQRPRRGRPVGATVDGASPGRTDGRDSALWLATRAPARRIWPAPPGGCRPSAPLRRREAPCGASSVQGLYACQPHARPGPPPCRLEAERDHSG
ncbi:MAG: DUF2505 family protein [Microthrixaceae bacterium]|nr:DUF2505 family protein [Microthrixaceae bacterium]